MSVDSSRGSAEREPPILSPVPDGRVFLPIPGDNDKPVGHIHHIRNYDALAYVVPKTESEHTYHKYRTFNISVSLLPRIPGQAANAEFILGLTGDDPLYVVFVGEESKDTYLFTFQQFRDSERVVDHEDLQKTVPINDALEVFPNHRETLEKHPEMYHGWRSVKSPSM